MITLLRHLLAILLLPFMVIVAVPSWILYNQAAIDSRWEAGSFLAWPARLAGAVLFLAAFLLFAWCVILFARVGRGTLAPGTLPRAWWRWGLIATCATR